RHRDDDLREPRQRVIRAEILEDVLERRNDPAEENAEDAAEDDQDGARIDHRAAELTTQLDRLFVVDGETRQNRVEDAADLARLNEVDVERVEDLRVPAERVAEGGALLGARFDVAEHDREALVVRLVAEDVEALNDGKTGVDHRREETRERHDVLQVDARADA